MKKIIITLLFIISVSAQNIIIKASYGMNFHTELKEENDPNVPDFYEQIDDIPSIGHFFDDNTYYEISAMIHFLKKEYQYENGHLFLGLLYSNGTLKSKLSGLEEAIMGEKLDMTTIAPFLGYAAYILDGYESGFFYFGAGPAFITYEGTSNYLSMDFTTKYKKSLALYATGGINIRMSKHLALDFGGGITYGSTTPEKWIANGESVDIETDTNLKDLTLRIQFGLAYTF